jgi:hypothetical protein
MINLPIPKAGDILKCKVSILDLCDEYDLFKYGHEYEIKEINDVELTLENVEGRLTTFNFDFKSVCYWGNYFYIKD